MSSKINQNKFSSKQFNSFFDKDKGGLSAQVSGPDVSDLGKEDSLVGTLISSSLDGSTKDIRNADLGESDEPDNQTIKYTKYEAFFSVSKAIKTFSLLEYNGLDPDGGFLSGVIEDSDSGGILSSPPSEESMKDLYYSVLPNGQLLPGAPTAQEFASQNSAGGVRRQMDVELIKMGLTTETNKSAGVIPAVSNIPIDITPLQQKCYDKGGF